MTTGLTLNLPEDKRAPQAAARRFTPVVVGFVYVGLAGLLVANLLGLIASRWWFADLFTHFQLQYFFTAAAACAGAMYARRRRFAAVAALFLIMHGGALAPYIMPAAADESGGGDRATVSVLQWNVYIGNHSYQDVIRRIRELRPDFVLLEEIDEKWADALEQLRDEYPNQQIAATGAPFGIAFLSRRPLESVTIRDVGAELRNVVTARLPGGVTLFGVHVISPVGGAHSAWRNRQLQELAQLVRQTDGPVVVAGDLNVSPFSPHHRRLLESADLLDARVGRGLLNSWPVGFAPVRIPIDQLLHRPEVTIEQLIRPGDSGNSDHFPLLCRIRVDE